MHAVVACASTLLRPGGFFAVEVCYSCDWIPNHFVLAPPVPA